MWDQFNLSAKLIHVTTLLNYDLTKNLELTATYQGRDVKRGPGSAVAAAAAAARDGTGGGGGGGGARINFNF